MNHSLIVRPTLFIVAAAAIAACSSGGGSSTTTSAPTPAAAASARPVTNAAMAAAPSRSPVTPALIATGDSIFHAASCQRCHGADARGARNGPNLTGPTFMHINGTGSYDDFVRIITSGMPADSIKDKTHQFPMRARGGNPPLTDDQVKAVAAYVYSLSHKS